jgi:four helix bundle protein
LSTKNSTSIALNSDSSPGLQRFWMMPRIWSAQHRRELIEQLDRASLSVLLNTAEGNGQRAKFFEDARGSAFECAACLDASVAKGFVSIDRVPPGKKCLPVSQQCSPA